MKSLLDHLSQYADYHREQRNIYTHFVGVPMILLAVVVLLSRPVWQLEDGWLLNPAMPVAVLASLYYLRLDLRYGLSMALVLAGMLWLGLHVAQGAWSTWLGWGIGLFVVGWVIQFVGHFWEGRKPAFMDDIVGLLIGPLFVMAELGFLLGWRLPLQQAIEARSGPVRPGRATAQA